MTIWNYQFREIASQTLFYKNWNDDSYKTGLVSIFSIFGAYECMAKMLCYGEATANVKEE